LRDKAVKPATPRRRGGVGDLATYGLIAAAVVLGWQMAIQPLMQRAPVEAAVGLAPWSPLVLRRAAESELAAGRIDNAAALSRDALVRSPFDVRALRVLGLTEARAGRVDRADDILTLAGNWSLRDDPAHAWLVERRLRRGDYTSAFAHADTLVRRREDIQPQVFRLFTVAGSEDPQRALPVIIKLLANRPPWRTAYLNSLSQTPEELQLAANLAILLQAGRAPLVRDELQHLYWTLLTKHQFAALTVVRERINRPHPGVAVTNGHFSDPAAPEPFQWRLIQAAGIVAEIVGEDLQAANLALRVEYDSYATGTVAEQLTSLAPGSYQLTAKVRAEAGNPTDRFVWTLSCVTGGGAAIATMPGGTAGGTPDAWRTRSVRFDVPQGCPVQWLRLETRADDSRSSTIAWFDQVEISPLS